MGIFKSHLIMTYQYVYVVYSLPKFANPELRAFVRSEFHLLQPKNPLFLRARNLILTNNA